MSRRPKRYQFSPAVWQRAWAFEMADIDLLRPIARELEKERLHPDLDSYLGYIRDRPEFHRAHFSKLKTRLHNRLKAFDVDIPTLFEHLEPAVFFHTVWFYQMCRREDRAAKTEGKYGAYTRVLRDLSSQKPLISVPDSVRVSIQRGLNDRTPVDAYELPDLEAGWRPKQKELLRKYLGAKLLAGKQSRSRKDPHTYIVHKEPVWRVAMHVLVNRLRESSPKKADRNLYPVVYSVLRFIFPDVFGIDKSEEEAFQEVRQRIRNKALAPASTT